MTPEQLQQRSKFSAAELLALAAGPASAGGAALLPGSWLLPFHEITRISWDPASGSGRIDAVRHNRLDDWFYGCHFRGDPIMPGCWGLDAVWHALRFFAAWRGLRGCDKMLGIGDVSFFGQIRPYDRAILYSVEIVSVEEQDGEHLVTGKATVSVDGAPVYTIGSVQVGTSFWEDDGRAAPPAATAPAEEPPLLQKLDYAGFASRDRFSHAELIAISEGSLIDAPSVEIGLLPAPPMLEISRVDKIAFDPATREGSIAARRDNDSLEWFYAMGGSAKPPALSIDGIWQLLGLFLAWRQNSGTGRALGLERVEVFDTIRPADRLIRYAVNVTKLYRAEGSDDAFARADAEVFADGRRILSCVNASVGCHKNIRYSGYPLRGARALGGSLKTEGAKP